jgi:hypothetical protein
MLRGVDEWEGRMGRVWMMAPRGRKVGGWGDIVAVSIYLTELGKR